MFEFEMPGDIDDLKKMEYELCQHLGFKMPTEKTYAEWQKHYGLAEDYEMTADEETKMHEEFGTTMITDFPELTSPFWNMSRNADGKTAKKIDVILGGMETIGSAERSCDVDMMRDTFHSITDGAYSKLLYELFSKERVEAELEKFLEFDFFPRVGGGIGMTRMISALEKHWKDQSLIWGGETGKHVQLFIVWLMYCNIFNLGGSNPSPRANISYTYSLT